MRRYQVVGLSALLLAVVAILAYLQLPKPLATLDASTPRVQNGLRITEIKVCEGLTTANRYLQLCLEAPEELHRYGQRSYQLTVRDSEGYTLKEPALHHTLWQGKSGRALEVQIPLNHPPSVRYFDVMFTVGNRQAHWRVIPPEPQRAFEPPPAYDEWVRLPEVEVRLGAEVVVDDPRVGSGIQAGFREYKVLCSEPFHWYLGIDDIVPEWVSPVESSQRKAGASDSGPYLRPSKHSVLSRGVSGAHICAPYAMRSSTVRLTGYLQKSEMHTETLDLSGLPVRLAASSSEQPIVVPVRAAEYKTPSGARVVLAEPGIFTGSAPPKGWRNLVLRIDIPPSAKQNSPLYAKYQQPPTISWHIEHKPRPQPYGYTTRPPVAEGPLRSEFTEVAIPVRPVRTKQGWVIPELKIEFTHIVRFGKKYPFERYVQVARQP